MDQAKLYEEIAPLMFSIAFRYSRGYNKRYTATELVNQVWVMGRIQDVHPKLRVKRIHWDILEFIRTDYFGRMGEKQFKVKHPFELSDVDFYYGYTENNGIDDHDEFEFLLRGINHDDRIIMRLYYVGGYYMKEIAKIVGYTESRISQKIKLSHEIIKANYERCERHK